MGLRDRLRSFFPLPEDELEALFDEAHYVLDTNVLLNLYRLGPIARTEVISALQQHLQGRAWILPQVALEFAKNRTKVILEADELLVQRISELKERYAQLDAALKADELRQFASPRVVEAAQNSCANGLPPLLKALEEQLSGRIPSVQSDPVLKLMDSLSSPLLGIEDPDQAWYEAAAKEAESRYQKKFPPGYLDDHKDEVIFLDSSLRVDQRFGDYYLWKQLKGEIEARRDLKPKVILVTGDRKEDWWSIVKGKTIGPRHELRREASEAGASAFHMYQMNRLVALLSKRGSQKPGNVPISEKTINEVRSVEAQAPTKASSVASSLHLSQTRTTADSLVGHYQSEGYRGYTSQRAVEEWLRNEFLNAEIVENDDFPDLVVKEYFGNDLNLHGIEVVTPRSADHLRALIYGKYQLARSWLAASSTLWTGSPDRQLTFVVTLSPLELSGLLQHHWSGIASALRSEVKNACGADILIGTLDGDRFRPI